MSTLDRAVTRSRIDELWSWLAGALFLLVSVDTLTTLAVHAQVGLAHEINPLMRWLLTRGLLAVVLANLVATVLISVFFWATMVQLRATESPRDRYFALVIELWLGTLIAFGLGLFANNLSVLFLGRSLL